ncbi:MAG: ABC transporter ATP-binding protein [Acetatifactor sp.]|nr:ABC transporter ATP-binding protein [Acetatifactor sp.]
METVDKEFVPKHYSILSDILFYIRFLRQEEPAVLVFGAVQIILESVAPLLGIWLPKLTLDLVMQGVTMARVVMVLGGFVLLMMAFNGINGAVHGGKYQLYNIQRDKLMGILFLKSLRIKYENVEAGTVKNIYEKACGSLRIGDQSASSRMVSWSIEMCVNVLSFALFSTVIGTLNIWILTALIALSFVNYALYMSLIQRREVYRNEDAKVWRHFFCVRGSMMNHSRAKDVKIFGMKRWLLQRMDLMLGEVETLQEKYRRVSMFHFSIIRLLSAFRDLGAYAWLLYQATQGKMTAGEFVLYFGAITGFSDFVTGFMKSLADLRGAANDTDYIRAYLELPEEDRSKGTRHIDELVKPLSIEFKDVSFAYKYWENDNSEGVDRNQKGKSVFQHLNLCFHPGEKVALVGVNGAGKTTLVKLLCGLYDPDEGHILINGIDRNEFPREELYRLFSVVFQETMIMPFTVGENISLDRAERVDEQKAWDSLEKAGLKEIFTEKGIGIRSYLTRQMMDNGVELSGGQNQRLMLARALYKDAPVLILDEPTAALDPIAESQIYESYRKHTDGKTTLFISHRLASTRFSDRIVMIADGRILEQGTHEELMRADGPYAKMFAVQSSYYTDESEKAQDIG